jgi:hypothetical protein
MRKNGRNGKSRAASRKMAPEIMEIVSTVLEEITSKGGLREETALHEAGHMVAALALGYGIKHASIKLEISEPRGTSVDFQMGLVHVDACITAKDLELARNGDISMLQKCEEGCLIYFAGAIAVNKNDMPEEDTEKIRIFFPPCFNARYGHEMADNETDRIAVADLADEYIGKTCHILAENWGAVELATTMLLEKETLSPEDIEDVRKAITLRTPTGRAEKAIA